MTEASPQPPGGPTSSTPRSTIIRDVLVLQWKLLLGNLHNLVLVPATLAAALFDIVMPESSRPGAFYRVLEWGRSAEEAIGLYRALEDRPEHERRGHAGTAYSSRAPDMEATTNPFPNRVSDPCPAPDRDHMPPDIPVKA
jgi:hypothetical protein